jgi:UDP-N-acetylmuramoyl-L-alanyl-D-glutamate--2,6-diaminopimelate ligase
MRLRKLLLAVPGVDLSTVPDLDVFGVQEDSRRVTTGDLFIARRGSATDGAAFIDEAHQRGAVAVVAAKQIITPLPTIVVSDPTAAASLLANRLQGDPSHDLKVLGVTGTNGKTTVTFLLQHLARHASQPCGLIGTCITDDGSRQRSSAMTTPGPVEVASLLADMRDRGRKAVAMEVSSHALDQRRVAGVTFAGAAFTNLTGDHLDYHGTLENYAAAKAKLFEMLDTDVPAVVNARDPAADRMLRDCRGRAITFGIDCDADYNATHLQTSADGSAFYLETPRGSTAVTSKLIGRHNVENLLAAAALASEVFELSPAKVADGLADAPAAPGRLESVHDGGPVAVLVDYAHTDDALENVLLALRPLTTGRVRVVFGCGGDRDKTKRPRMAAVAERLADDLIITSDNPRTEDPTAILRDIKAGLTKPDRATLEVDRRAAICIAIDAAEPGDCVLVAGKGHEDYQIVGVERLPFDDRVECRSALERKQVPA